MSANNWAACPKCYFSESLREDYEIGIWKGSFSVVYSAQCNQCGWEYSFEHEDDVSHKITGKAV